MLTFYLITEYARLVPTDMLGPTWSGASSWVAIRARALPHLARACDDGESKLPPEFLRECRRMIVDAAYRIGDFPRARAALDRAVVEANGEADRLRALDMRERVDWAAGRRVGPVAGDAPGGHALRHDCVAWEASLDGGRTHETMAPMTRLRRAALLGCVTLLVASVARAQVEPPPATSLPPAAPGAPTTAPATPPAPPPATAPVEPLSPTMAPEAAGAPPLVLSERTEPLQPVARPEPFYDRAWFWGAATLVVATVVLILLFNHASNDHGPPDTTFGNMHAF